MANLAHKTGILTPYLTIALFGGLRPAELQRLSWTDIDIEGATLVVRGAAAKLRARRLVTADESSGTPDHVKTLLPVRQIDWRLTRVWFQPVKQVIRQRRKNESDEGRKAWAYDILRHTSLSYRLAVVKHEGENL